MSWLDIPTDVPAMVIPKLPIQMVLEKHPELCADKIYVPGRLKHRIAFPTGYFTLRLTLSRHGKSITELLQQGITHQLSRVEDERGNLLHLFLIDLANSLNFLGEGKALWNREDNPPTLYYEFNPGEMKNRSFLERLK